VLAVPGAGVAREVTLDPNQVGLLVAALCAAVVVSFVLTPFAIRIATRLGAIDRPDEGRRVHRLPIPRGGGMAVAAAFVATGSAVVLLQPAWFPSGLGGQLAALFGGVALAAVLGFVDDRWQIRARWQLVEQLVLVAVAILGGIVITQIANPFQFLGFAGASPDVRWSLNDPFALILTGLWIVGMINSINFVDGLDGLSTGVSLVAAATLGVISLTTPGQYHVALLCAALAGSLAGFLPWNFYPARVFIGTTGVFAIGYALAALSILGVAKVAVALLVLGVPIIDTFWIIIRRVMSGHSPFEPDRGHLHHRLLDLGLTHRGAVLLIYAVSVMLAALSIVLANRSGALYAFMGVMVGGGLVLFLLTRRSRDALDARSYPDAPPGPEDVADDRRHEARAAR
jgi:UDP-GlcNAc:undecaprenyl-phosphate GlcNAc-1-phosphate transferase